MTCPACGAELSFARPECPRCGHVADPFPGPASPPDGPQGQPAAVGPTLAFGSPQQYASTHPADAQAAPAGFAYGVPTPEWAQPQPAPRKRRLVPALVVTLAVLLCGGGAAAAAFHFGWLGGGPRPAEVIPGSAVGYLQLDLNPSVAQQASAWQFLRDVPAVKSAVAAGQTDPKAIAWKLLDSSLPSSFASVDYDKDVKPWLGDRIGVAALPHDKAAAGVVAIQVNDAQLAQTTLRGWSAKAADHFDVTMRDGFALLTRTDDTSFVLKELDAGSLAGNQTFADDIATLGDPGFAAGWADLAGLAKIEAGKVGGFTAQGRSVAALTFSADTAQLHGTLTGLADTGLVGSADIGKLPASTWAALGFAGGGAAVEKDWPSLGAEFRQSMTLLGLDEDDLVALLGREFQIGLSHDSSMFPVGLRSVTDDSDGAKAAIQKVVEQSGDAVRLSVQLMSDGVIASNSMPYLTELNGTASTLAGDADFAKAVPDHASAAIAAYVKLPTLYETLGVTASTGGGEFAKALRAAGAEYVAKGDGSGNWSVRLVRS